MVKIKTQCLLGLIPGLNFFIVHICSCINAKHMKKGWQSSLMVADVIGIIAAILLLEVISAVVPVIHAFRFKELLVFYIWTLFLTYPAILAQKMMMSRNGADPNSDGNG